MKLVIVLTSKACWYVTFYVYFRKVCDISIEYLTNSACYGAVFLMYMSDNFVIFQSNSNEYAFVISLVQYC